MIAPRFSLSSCRFPLPWGGDNILDSFLAHLAKLFGDIYIYIYIHIHTHTHTHTNTHTFVCVCMCVCVLKMVKCHMLLELPLLLYGTLIVASLIVLLTKQYFLSIACLQERPAMIRELSLHFPLLGRIETNTQVGILRSAIYSKCVLLDFRRQLCFTFLGYMTCSYSKIF